MVVGAGISSAVSDEIEVRASELEFGRTISIAEVSRATGLHRDTIKRLMDGETSRFDEPVIDKICKFFGVPDGPIPFLAYERNYSATKVTLAPPMQRLSGNCVAYASSPSPGPTWPLWRGQKMGLERLYARTNPGFFLKVNASIVALAFTNLDSNQGIS